MMLLDLFKDLTYGELSQLKVGNLIPGEHESEVDPTRYAQVLTWVNLGLTAIYTRFLLSRKEIVIQQYEAIPTYILLSDFAISNVASSEDPKYIVDTALDPFQDDVLHIEEVYDEEDEKLFLNDVTEETSLFTPDYRSIKVPDPDDAVTMTVHYRAAHPLIEYVYGMDPSIIEIMLPIALHEAFLNYIGSRAYAALGGDQGVEGNDYYQKFENSCNNIERFGLEIQPEPGSWRFDARGWV
jgi:hypothetical protein